MRKIALAFGAAAFVLSAHAAFADEKLEANKKTVVEFYNKAINDKDFEAARKYMGPKYIQHNPSAADGPEGLAAFLKFLKEKFGHESYSRFASSTIQTFQQQYAAQFHLHVSSNVDEETAQCSIRLAA